MNLRPHHALCIQKFTGHGYDRAFTDHMTELCETLKNQPETPVRIISGCDELCAFCPNRENGSCSTLEKVDSMDIAVRSAAGLSPGGTLPWRELAGLARTNIFETDQFEKICSDCQWFALCRSTPLN